MHTTPEDLTRDLAAFHGHEDDSWPDELVELIRLAHVLASRPCPIWQGVDADGTQRLPVPGGWLYLVPANFEAGTWAPVFVPDPAGVPDVYVEALALVQRLAEHAPIEDDEGSLVVNVTEDLASLLVLCAGYR